MRPKRRFRVAGMERADVQQEAALEAAAAPTVERQRGQQRIQAPSYISPRDPRLQLTGLASGSQTNTQPLTTPAQPLQPGSAADGEVSGSLVSDESEQEQAESSDRQPEPAQPAGSEGQQGAEERSQRQCSHCGSSAPVGKWCRHPTTRALLCHACGEYARTNTGHLPSAAVLQRRVQQRKAVPPNQRQCMQCGASTPGAGRAHWHRHPATKQEWLCKLCYFRAYRQLKRKRQHEAPATAMSSDGEEEAWEEGEEAQPPSQSPPAPQQQAAPEQPPMPGPPVQQIVPANMIVDQSAEAGQQELQALSQRQQQHGVTLDATWETAPEQPALLPANIPPPPQASTGLLVLEAVQQAAAAAAGLTEEVAGTFAALLPMPAEQDECLRLMLQRRQYSGAAGLMRAVLHVRGIPHPG